MMRMVYLLSFMKPAWLKAKQAKALESPEPVWNTPIFKLYCNSNYKKYLKSSFSIM